jgi:hypothetical protein
MTNKEIKELELELEKAQKDYFELRTLVQKIARIILVPELTPDVILDRVRAIVSRNDFYSKQISIIREVIR